MCVEKSYKIKYIKDGKEVWAWLAPDVDPEQFQPLLEKILVMVLKAEEGMVLVKDGEEIGTSTFINSEDEVSQYTEKEAEDPEPIPLVNSETK